MKICPLSRQELQQLSSKARVIEQDSHGIKVLALPDGNFLKYFRRKRFLNRELLAPAAVRFTRNARQLQQLGVPTLQVRSLHRITGESHTVVIYRPLPGETLRDLLAEGRVDRDLSYRIGVFMARLHRLGIFFRSVHPGNIVIDDNRAGLIDVLDMRFRPYSLLRWERRRNWLHFLRCEEDKPHWKPELIDELLVGYRDAADLPDMEMETVAVRVQSLLAPATRGGR